MNQNDIDALEASGLKPIIIEDDTDIARVFETNEEFVSRIMNFGCPTGALIQAFVIEALSQYCAIVEENHVPDTPFMLGSTWKATGAWLKSELEKKYGTPR
jgi:hypothetical protein